MQLLQNNVLSVKYIVHISLNFDHLLLLLPDRIVMSNTTHVPPVLIKYRSIVPCYIAQLKLVLYI